MSHRNKALVAIVAGTALLISSGAAIGQAAIADERSGKAMQTLNVDFATETGNFRGGASGTLYGLGDDGSPADAILDGAQVENSSQKPPSGTQHPSGDALALENQFFSNGGNELAVYMQDYYPDWSYNSGNRPSDSRRGDPLAKPTGTAHFALRTAVRPRPALLPLRRLDRPGLGISGKPHRMDSDGPGSNSERLAQQPPRPTLSPEEDSADGNSCGAKRWLYYRPA